MQLCSSMGAPRPFLSALVALCLAASVWAQAQVPCKHGHGAFEYDLSALANEGISTRFDLALKDVITASLPPGTIDKLMEQQKKLAESLTAGRGRGKGRGRGRGANPLMALMSQGGGRRLQQDGGKGGGLLGGLMAGLLNGAAPPGAGRAAAPSAGGVGGGLASSLLSGLLGARQPGAGMSAASPANPAAMLSSMLGAPDMGAMSLNPLDAVSGQCTGHLFLGICRDVTSAEKCRGHSAPALLSYKWAGDLRHQLLSFIGVQKMVDRILRLMVPKMRDCKDLGALGRQKMEALDASNPGKGVMVSYVGPERCLGKRGQTMGINVAIKCDPQAQSLKLVRKLTGDFCSFNLTFVSSAACPKKVETCAPGCPRSWLSNGVCDRACHNTACGWDKSDCEEAGDQALKVCSVSGNGTCTRNLISDGVCDLQCMTASCDWDGVDCYNLFINAEVAKNNPTAVLRKSASRMRVCEWACPPSWLGNGRCDATCNTAACRYDGGDCQAPSSRSKQCVFSPTKYSVTYDLSPLSREMHGLALLGGYASMSSLDVSQNLKKRMAKYEDMAKRIKTQQSGGALGGAMGTMAQLAEIQQLVGLATGLGKEVGSFVEEALPDMQDVYFSLCRDTTSLDCEGRPAPAVMELLGGGCRNLGSLGTQQVRLLNKYDPQAGVYVKYERGGTCPEGNKRSKLVVQVNCDLTAHQPIIQPVELLDGCRTMIRINSTAGCPIEGRDTKRVFCSPMCDSSWLNDGTCDPECNTYACNLDGGDCFNPKNVRGLWKADRRCAWGCPTSWRNDGECDEGCFTESCDWDGSDCSGRARVVRGPDGEYVEKSVLFMIGAGMAALLGLGALAYAAYSFTRPSGEDGKYSALSTYEAVPKNSGDRD